MNVLHVSLVQPKPTLMPVIDDRLLQMVASPLFFPQVATLAKQVAQLETSKDPSLCSDNKLSQHPLVRAIGFQDSIKYLFSVYNL